jgi:parallel beta-helix repeat protein
MEFTIRCSLPVPPEWPLPNGIVIESSINSTILNNEVKEFPNTGITVFHCSNTHIIGNYINYCGVGIYLESSDNSKIAGNSAIGINGVGVQTVSSNGNSIYSNNFDKNGPPQAAVIPGDINTWDSGYPYGGNYWSDYTGTDLYSGPYQNQTGSDGIGDTPYIIDANNQDNYPLMNPCTPPDIAVMNAIPSKTFIGQGYSASINVTVENQGSYAETLEVIAYVNTSVINIESVILTNGTSTTVTFTWNTTDFAKGNYTISASVTPVSGETDITDNTCIDGWVVVTIPGDFNGDYYVEIYDIVKICWAYNTKQGDPEYKPVLDIDDDGDIDIFDVVIACVHYGQKDP